MMRTSSLLPLVQRRGWNNHILVVAGSVPTPPTDRLLRWCPPLKNGPLVGTAAAPPQQRSYISRAHPRPPREFAVPEAIALILKDIERRQKKRVRRLEYFLQRKPLIVQKHASTKPIAATTTKDDAASPQSTPFDPAQVRHPVETFELAICLNLDPRKPGQSLRGSITLPHGTGKKGRPVVVLTNDATLVDAALAAGAAHAGGEALLDQIVAGTRPVDGIAAILATTDIMPVVTKKAARLLGPRGLMPNLKVGTLHTQAPALLAALESAVAGKEVTYRTEKEGIVHVPVGNHTFPLHKLLDNIGTVMKTIQEVKPDSYGKGKKKQAKKGQALSAKSQPKYVLRVSMSSTQSKGVRVDLRTLDPNSAFFLSTLDPLAMQRVDEVRVRREGPEASAASEASGRTISAAQ
jgi:large subunit ribosomal protein L1